MGFGARKIKFGVKISLGKNGLNKCAERDGKRCLFIKKEKEKNMNSC